ncbi:hypothetical protein [Spirosoma arcticum]
MKSTLNRCLLSLTVLAGCLLLDGCIESRSTEPATDKWDTYRPIYSSYDQIRTVETLAPRPIRTPGKIYVKDGFLFINDVGQGIHIVDNHDPANPIKLSFVAVPGVREVAIKDSILYTDNIVDLVALNVADPRNVRLVKRIENAFPYTAYPPMRNVRFECPDSDKGLIVGWEKTDQKDAQCYR